MIQLNDVYHVRNYLNSVIQQGSQITDQNITQLPEDGKENIYRKIMQLDVSLTRVNLYGELERLYRTILKNIKNSKTGWDAFKPNFLIRLGFSLLQQKRYEEGLSYILQGYRLDPHRIQDILKKESDFDLFKDQARTIIYKRLSQFTIFGDGQHFYNETKQFLSSFDIEEQLHIIEIVEKFELHSSLNRDYDNLSSRRVLFSCLNQLCTFTESILRQNLNVRGSTLGPLVDKFSQLDCRSTWTKFYCRSKKSISKSPNYIEFNRNLRTIKVKSERTAPRSIAKYFLYLYCVRNFTGHHFTVKHRRSEFLFKFSKYRSTAMLNIEFTFWSVFGSLWYILRYFHSRP